MMEKLLTYNEIYEDIEEDFNRYLDKNDVYKFTTIETVAKLLYEYEEILKKEDIESKMINIEIVRNLIKHKRFHKVKHDKMIKPIIREVAIIHYNIEEHKSEFQGNDYELVKAELENIIKEIEK